MTDLKTDKKEHGEEDNNVPNGMVEDVNDDDSNTDEQEESEGDYEDDEESENDGDEEDNGPETSVANNAGIPYPSHYLKRDPNPTLPETVTVLRTTNGATVYVVGTAHFSESSQDDVSKTINATQPDVVLVELCKDRQNMLLLDEKKLLEEAKNMNLDKMRTVIKQNGVVQGFIHILLLSISAHITKELGMAPGGEFRRAFNEAQKIPGCRVHLGDRPIQVTMRRVLGALTFWQKVKLAWQSITCNESISKEDVERCKQKDILEEMLTELTGELPALSHVLVHERDIFLAHSLRAAAHSLPPPHPDAVTSPTVVVGVVGMGHVPGIIEQWKAPATTEEIKQLIQVPKASVAGRVFVLTVRASVVGLVAWGGYKLVRYGSRLLH